MHHFAVNDECRLVHSGIDPVHQRRRSLERLVDNLLNEQRRWVDDDQRYRGSVVDGRCDEHHDYDDDDDDYDYDYDYGINDPVTGTERKRYSDGAAAARGGEDAQRDREEQECDLVDERRARTGFRARQLDG